MFGLAFLPVPDGDLTLAILHLDYQDRVQLVARDINISEFELSSYPSSFLNPTSISAKILPCPTESVPQLVSVPAAEIKSDDEEDDEENFIGGIMIVGGKKIVLFEMTKGQTRQSGKRRRFETKTGSEAEKGKEKEREVRKRKPKASVEWPWGDVTAYSHPLSFLVSKYSSFF